VELPLYLGLGFVSGLVAILFKFLLAKSDEFFKGNIPGLSFMARIPR
jgi:H+/Cl- antiporter ClcA